MNLGGNFGGNSKLLKMFWWQKCNQVLLPGQVSFTQSKIDVRFSDKMPF
jgi:hypothetical protein